MSGKIKESVNILWWSRAKMIASRVKFRGFKPGGCSSGRKIPEHNCSGRNFLDPEPEDFPVR